MENWRKDSNILLLAPLKKKKKDNLGHWFSNRGNFVPHIVDKSGATEI